MARTYKEEDREYFINLVGNYFMDEDMPSIRKCANYLEENIGIKLSATTIKTYIHTYVKNNPKKGLDILNKLNNNKPKTVSFEEVKQRTLKAAQMVRDNNTIEDIAEYLNTTFSTIHKDLTVRLKSIDIKLYEEIKTILNRHSISNLKQGNDTYFNQERDIDGRFKK